MNSIRVFGLTQPHVGETDKPNEDAWLVDAGSTMVVVADGVSRSRLSDGSYPAEHSTKAPQSFVETVVENLVGRACSMPEVRSAMEVGNRAVAFVNQKLWIDVESVDYGSRDYFGTTGLVLYVDQVRGKAMFAFIGDVIAIYLPKNGSPKLLTRDQLHACHNFSYAHFSKAQGAERLLWQRQIARNNSQSRDPEGNLVGFGVLTGESKALHFLEGAELEISFGDIFVLASDALRVASSTGKEEEETISSYNPVLEAIREVAFEEWPKTLIDLIRRCEVAQKTRSDDATIVVAQVI